VEDLFDQPQHPYTVGLFRSIPKLGANGERLDTTEGMGANPSRMPPGSKSHPRCPRTRGRAAAAPADQTMQLEAADPSLTGMRRCVGEGVAPTGNGRPLSWGEPALREVRPKHWAACHYTENFDTAPETEPVLSHKRATAIETLEV